MLKAAFIFVAEGADGQKDRSVVTTPSVELITVGVVDYAEAVVISKQLVEEDRTMRRLRSSWNSKDC